MRPWSAKPRIIPRTLLEYISYVTSDTIVGTNAYSLTVNKAIVTTIDLMYFCQYQGSVVPELIRSSNSG